jgi:hypothetical protein
MSKHNKVNKSNYVQGGRLTPDEMARERKRQAEVSSHAKGGERVTAKAGSTHGARGASRPRSAPEE